MRSCQCGQPETRRAAQYVPYILQRALHLGTASVMPQLVDRRSCGGGPWTTSWTVNCGNIGDGCCVNDLNEFSTRFQSMSVVSRNSLSLCSGRAQATLTLQ